MREGNERRKRHQELKRDRDRQQEKEKIIVRKAYNTTDRQTSRQSDNQTDRQTHDSTHCDGSGLSSWVMSARISALLVFVSRRDDRCNPLFCSV